MQMSSAHQLAPVGLDEIFVAPGDVQEFQRFQSSLSQELKAGTEFEYQCLRTVIHSLWTIRRTRAVECKMQERAFNDGKVDPLLDVDWARQLNGVLKVRRQAERSYENALKDLRRSQRERKSKDAAAPRTDAHHPQPTAAPTRPEGKVIAMPSPPPPSPPPSLHSAAPSSPSVFRDAG